MNTKINTTIVFLLTIFLNQIVFSKPYQPQVNGGFRSVVVMEYRYSGSKVNMNSGVKSYSSKFDEHGNLIEMISYENNKISSTIRLKNKYNSKGLLVELAYFDETGKPTGKFSYGYDDNANMILDTMYNAQGEMTTKGYHKYDKNNFLIEETYVVKIDSTEWSKGTTYFQNDKWGNKIVESANHSMNISAEVTSEVNLENGVTKSKVNTNQTPSQSLDKITYEYKYDDKGNILRQVRTSFDGYKLIHEFKYDEFGNIIEQISFDEKGKPYLKTVFEYSK